MFRILFLLWFITIPGFSGFAQTQIPQSYKFDEFGELQETEWKSRLDKFAETHIAESNSTLRVIVYAQIGAERTSIDDLIMQYSNYLIKSTDAEFVSVSPGGFRKSQATELWVCPKKADFPKPTPDEKFKPEKFAVLGELDKTAFKRQIQDFYGKLNSEVWVQGYIINYGTDAELRDREDLIKESISFLKLDAVRVTIVRGGNIGSLTTVLWIVPTGADPPTP